MVCQIRSDKEWQWSFLFVSVDWKGELQFFVHLGVYGGGGHNCFQLIKLEVGGAGHFWPVYWENGGAKEKFG